MKVTVFVLVPPPVETETQWVLPGLTFDGTTAVIGEVEVTGDAALIKELRDHVAILKQHDSVAKVFRPTRCADRVRCE